MNFYSLSRSDYESLFDPPRYNIPNSDDEYIQIDNIIMFLNENNDTEQQIGFQGNNNGKFYVKAGNFINNSNPNIVSSGTLIYDIGNSNAGKMIENYKCAAHLGNIINYILYKTKGSDYGSETALFADTPSTTDSSTYGFTNFGGSIIAKGIYDANGSNSFYCSGRGDSGYYGNRHVSSYDNNAIWW